eukprot:NODE_5241_length_680_cov_20.446655_g5078_i0.p2 GENE.NODE_5241_length_680_cov_20.446655_g5078_i0~~NODE_5241_length_680_cov_20.446655_g5078_i0.p2  ORF type:complete len:127 (+),score=37.10 NODE_5241_length_680_cov_20.446655_g5078_i0:286-666(+)
MLAHYHLELAGNHHCGIDDCKNIASLTTQLLKAGCKFPPKGVRTVADLPDGFRHGDWVCDRCNEHNFKRLKKCRLCTAEREDEPTKAKQAQGTHTQQNCLTCKAPITQSTRCEPCRKKNYMDLGNA